VDDSFSYTAPRSINSPCLNDWQSCHYKRHVTMHFRLGERDSFHRFLRSNGLKPNWLECPSFRVHPVGIVTRIDRQRKEGSFPADQPSERFDFNINGPADFACSLLALER
jgi:hypothetical protein